MQKTAYELRISDWSSDVCSSDLQHQTGLQLPYEILLVDAAAVLPGIAVHEDVVADGARIDAGEQVPAEVLGGDEEVGARQARPHPRRAVVGRQILSDPDRQARVGVGVDVAQSDTDMRRRVDREPGGIVRERRQQAARSEEHTSELQ